MRAYSLLLVSVLVLGCAVDTTGPLPRPLQPRFDVASGAATFPNVVRFRNEFEFLILDRNSDLLAIAGLPDHPKDVVECGGTEELHFAIADIQWVGVREEVVKALVSGTDYNLDVYQLSTFAGVCASNPIAHGTGKVRYHENDVFRTSDRTDTFGFSMTGQVSLTAGGTVNLRAHALFQIFPEGGFPREILSDVALSG
jgi:hypothetical protein